MWILALLFASVSAPAVEVGTLDGGAVSGSVVELSSQQVVLSTDDGEQTIEADRLLQVRAVAPEATAHNLSVWVELTDGSRLSGTGFTVSEGKASLAVGEGNPIEIPTAALRQVRFSPPVGEGSKQWPNDIAKKAAGDMLVVRKAEAVDFLEGVLGNVTNERIEFQIDGDTIPVNRTRIDGLIYFHKAADRLPDPVCVVEDAGVENGSGWRLAAKQVSLAEDGMLHVTTVSGVEVRHPFVHIAKIDYSSGKLVYLSDLEAETYQWLPLVDFGSAAPALAEFYAPRRNQGRELGPLRVGGKAYNKGLALASKTSITYRVPSGATRLKALAGIDDATRVVGQLALKIEADGHELFSAAITGDDPPQPIDVDLTGRRRLTISVDYGENLDIGDYLNLVDARIVK